MRQAEPEGGPGTRPRRPASPARHARTAARRPPHDHSALWATHPGRRRVQSFGNPQAHCWCWLLNRAGALACFDHFIATTLPHFGAYEDARAPRAHGCSIPCCLRAQHKMLRPHEVVQRAQAACRRHRALPAVGFYPPDIGLARNMCAASTSPHAGLRRAQRLGHHAVARLVLDGQDPHALHAGTPWAVVAGRPTPTTSSASWSSATLRCWRAGPRCRAPLVPGRVHRRL